MAEDTTAVNSPSSKVVLEMDSFPFKGLKISEDWQQLHSVSDRTLCSSCKKSRKYFCYTCYIPVPEIQHFVPKIKLPIKVDIIKHSREIDGKSTAVHAAVLAPEDVRIFTYPCIPDYDPSENVVLIFPNKNAVSVGEICEIFFRKVVKLGQQESVQKQVSAGSRLGGSLVRRAVFIDSTWNQSRGIFKDPRIKALPSVVLKSRLSQFWRHQTDSPRWYLATVEAVHQFLLELEEAQWRLGWDTTASTVSPSPSAVLKVNSDLMDQNRTDNSAIVDRKGCQTTEYSYNGKYDNILFFFRFMYSKIHTLYDHDQLRSYKRRLE